jgi:hypothetical protein
MSELPERTLEAVTKGREGFEYHEDGSFAIASGPAAVGLIRLKMIKTTLEFEIKTGMKMSRVSALKAANADLGTNYRTKKQALAHITSLLKSAGE